MNSRDFRERLIDEVQKYPVLYDINDDHHRDIDVRDRCWTEIAMRLGANNEVLKREWKILRDSLRQALKKSRGGARTKAGAPCKKWRFQNRMSFLLPHITLRNSFRHSASGRGTSSGVTSEGTKVEVEVEPEQSDSGGDDWSAPAAAAAGGGGGSSNRSRRSAARAAVVTTSPAPPPPPPPAAYDDTGLELFFASVCASARRLPSSAQRDLKRRVLDALLDVEANAKP